VLPAVSGFYHELATALERSFTQHDYYSLFSYWTVTDVTRDESRRSFDRILEHGVDGVVTVQYSEALADLGIPVVTYGNDRRLMDCVYPDKVRALNQAVEYLMAHGHREIGFMGLAGEIRGQAIRGILCDHGLRANPAWIVDGYTLYDDGYRSMKKIHSSGALPTAVITHSDPMAIGILNYAHETGLRVPADLSIVSYDNLPQAAYTVPPLTTFDQCYAQAAALLVKAMLYRIEHPRAAQQKYPIQLPLVERASVRTIRRRA
jgi:DNA-binding LacI/PurR family transcriptional regulator